MKNYILLIMSILANFAMSQSTASATAEGTILAPISIVNAMGLNFGNVAVSNSSGTVVLNELTGVRTTTGGTTLPSVTGTVTRAIFSVSGEAGYTFSITLPSAAITITHTNTINTMTVDNFAGPSTSSLPGGAQNFGVGATLNVGASQLAGFYTNATGFDVTVNYN